MSTEEQLEEDLNAWIVFGVAVALLLIVALAYHFSLPPCKTFHWKAHLAFVVVTGASYAIPTSAAIYIFNSLSVTLIGTIFPIYESLRAICTPDEEDDKYWLQYYLIGGILFICTQFVDEWLNDASAVTYWFHGMFFLYLWLYFPMTNGAAIVYDRFTEPFLSPIVRPWTTKITNCFTYIYHTGINACHIVLAVLFFVFFPDRLKKVIAVAVGTAYPWMASVTAATTDQVEDDTYWLTYWVCYSCLFVIMELLETWLGWIPGFYTFYIAATVYLMLPMFAGADKIFRKVLVPLARLQDLLILRDALMIKKRILSELDPAQAQAVNKAIVKFYENECDAKTMEEEGLLKRDLLSSWKNVQIPGTVRRWFGKKKNGADNEPDEKGGTAAQPNEAPDEPVTSNNDGEENTAEP